MRSMPVTLVLFVAGTIAISAQDPTAFEVASIKPNNSATVQPRVGFPPGGRFEAIAATLQGLITLAHGGGQMRPSQVVGGPAWIGTERFDINAQAENGTGPAPRVPPNQMLLMVQNLLADRFKLVVHWEKREQPIYALRFARPDRALGPRLRRAETDCDTRVAQIPANATQRPMVCGMEGAAGRALGRTMTLSDFATRQLPSILDRLVVDRTGADGIFDWDLEWTPGPGERSSTSVDGTTAPSTGGPSIFAALEEQLGLTLDPERAQVDVLVVDAVSRPTPD
jgi:bla regulator protein blaR1